MLLHTLISEKKENLVLDDWAAKIGAKLIFLIWSLRSLRHGIEKIARVQRIVAEKFKQFPMILVRAGARGEVYDRAGVSPVLRGERRIVDLVFRERVNRGLEGDLVLHRIVQIDSIHQPVGGVSPASWWCLRAGPRY